MRQNTICARDLERGYGTRSRKEGIEAVKWRKLSGGSLGSEFVRWRTEDSMRRTAFVVLVAWIPCMNEALVGTII